MAGRIHTLELVGRLRQRALEAQAGELRTLWARLAEIDAARAALHDALRAGPGASSLEAAPYLPGYLRAMRSEEAKLLEERAALEERIRQAEAALRQRFREAKANDLLLGNARVGQRAAQDRAEAAELDEIALRAFQAGDAGRL